MEANPRQKAQKLLLDKALEDKTFKQELIANPKAVLQKEFGTELPADVDVEVLENTPRKTYLVIPVKPPADVELPPESDVKPVEVIILKAWKDNAFKQELLANPKVVLQNALNVDLPADMEVKAVEERSNKLYIPLLSQQLSDLGKVFIFISN